jgi:hypothetical protein
MTVQIIEIDLIIAVATQDSVPLTPRTFVWCRHKMDESDMNWRSASIGMRLETSIFLDIVRFCAALVVAFDHLGDYTIGVFWPIGALGPQAVDVFFVLSGYVIAYAVSNRERSFTLYAVARCARLYSVVLPTLIISFVLGAAGTSLRPEVQWGDTSLVAYFRCLLFTNQYGSRTLRPGIMALFGHSATKSGTIRFLLQRTSATDSGALR